MTVKILLDTDIGGDFDDANALALLVGLRDVELVAVTTVGAGGDAAKRARLASHILELAGRSDVPVHTGIDRPSTRNPTLEALAHEMILNGYQEFMADAEISSQHAVDALVEAAVAAVRPQWLAFEELEIAVELHGELTRGMTVVDQDRFFNHVADASRVTVVSAHDPDTVLSLFAATVLEADWRRGREPQDTRRPS